MGGFTHPRRKDFEPLNLDTLEARLDAGTYGPAALREQKLIRSHRRVKLLSRGNVSKKFTLSVHAASAKAKESIEKAGGTVTIINE
jgi:large subunit ribosomal protein L15